ncbi:MAG: hypothetical protein ACRBBR_04015 [Cellvibrionaceae bacterium]
MFKSFKWVSLITLLVLLTACKAGVREPIEYQYRGEVYGVIDVKFTEDLAKKRKKYKDLKLERRVRSELKKYNLFNEKSTNKIEILIDTINFRSTVDAALLGSRAGSDVLEGQVSLIILKRKAYRKIHGFDVSATQSKGGPSNAIAKKRLKTLGQEFGKITAKEILRKLN